MSMKVLISDPDWRFSQQAAAYLEAHAHHVVSETRRQAAIERIDHWRPDLVILSADAVEQELMDRIYALPGRPAILLTGWMDRYAEAWRAWQAGGDELLMKPIFRTDDLHDAVVAAMENAATGKARRGAVGAAVSA